MISLPPFPIFIFNIYYVSFVCFWRQFPVARSCWHSCSVWVDPAVSTRLCYNGWGSDGQEEAGLWVCDSAFPCGFSHNKHRPLRVESFFQPFWDLLSEDFTAWQDTAGMGWEDSCICGILCLVLAGCGVLWFFMCYFSAPAPGPIINVCQPPRPHCCLCPIDPPPEDCNSTLQCYHICRVLGQCRTALGFVSVLALCSWLRHAHLRVSMPDVSDLCVEQGTVCGIMAAQLVVTSRGATWRSSHTAMLLHSL